MKITGFINKGNSFPVILEDKDKKYFVKLGAGMSGKYALLSEWFGNKLGTQLGIKTQAPIWINLDHDLIVDGIHIEVRDLLKKSVGLNIGFEYQEAAAEIIDADINNLSKEIIKEIFLFDLIMINIDRTPSNMNLMQVEGELISVDYESSLLLQELFENKNLLEDKRILQCLRTNPLYTEISDEELEAFIENLKQVSIHKVLEGIPLELLSELERNTIVKGIEEKIKNEWFLKKTIRKLKNLKAATKEEQKIRANKNQETFKRKFNENT